MSGLAERTCRRASLGAVTAFLAAHHIKRRTQSEFAPITVAPARAALPIMGLDVWAVFGLATTTLTDRQAEADTTIAWARRHPIARLAGVS